MDWCKWCTKAAEVLEERKLEYKKINMNEIDVDHYDGFGDALHKDLKVLTGQQTVPVVYIDQKFVGGYDAMMEYLKNV